jgi:hypothetical protein
MRKPHSIYLFITLTIFFAGVISGCTDAPPSIEKGPTPESFTDTPTQEPTPEPTNTPPPQDTPTITPTPISVFENLSCNTPMSLMLHSAYGEVRMSELAQVIIDNGLQTITYHTMMEGIDDGVCPPDNAIIVSLDDMGTSWLRPVFKDMIKEFTDKGLVLVAGVVTHSEQDPEIWEYLQQIEAQGIEVASHSINHLNLTAISEHAVEEEMVGSYNMICDYLGTCPITFILPGGNGEDDPRIYDIASGYYDFLVGIQGGRAFGSTPPYYVGRIPPDNNDQTITLTLLENSFFP